MGQKVLDTVNPLGYINCTVTRNPVRTDTMNRHNLHYIDLHPEPLKAEEPSPLMIWAGAALALLALWLITVFLFSL